VQSTFQTLQETLSGSKNVGFQFDKVNGSSMVIYKIVLEIEYDLDPWTP
jgi:hypothetical protein